jgi:hypothetical protein
MMKLERKLDKILSLLYDENLLHWKDVLSKDIIPLAKKKFNIDWKEPEMNMVLIILESDGYILHNKKEYGDSVSSYSLTVKGVQLKRNGGFVWARIKQMIINGIIVWAAVFTIAGTIFTAWDVFHKKTINKEKCEKHGKSNVGQRLDSSNTESKPEFVNEKMDSLELPGSNLRVKSKAESSVYWSPDPKCPIYGSVDPKSKDAEDNKLKNRPVNETGIAKKLQISRFLKGGEDSTFFKEDGKYYSVEGYILSGEEQGPETCNCDKSKQTDHDGDIHFYVTDHLTAKTKKWDCFIVEITPGYRIKHPEFNVSDYVNKHVRISGYLYYDGLHHRKNSIGTCKTCNKKKPDPQVIWRKTCWELHPVVKIEEI